MQFTKYDLGYLKRGSTVIVTLRGNAANVRLMDTSNFNAYHNGRAHRYAGGLVSTSPARLVVPSDGRWYVTVDLIGLRGSVDSTVNVGPPPLPPLRSMGTRPLTAIQHEPAPPPSDLKDDVEAWDIFISYASEDKDAVARPLAEQLQALGVTVWLDELELKIGDSLRRKIDRGLARSRFGVIVLSRRFFAKQWPQYELDGLVTRHVSGEQSLLPIWHDITKAEVVAASPPLADKIARSTAQFTVEEIAREIAEVVNPTHVTDI